MSILVAIDGVAVEEEKWNELVGDEGDFRATFTSKNEAGAYGAKELIKVEEDGKETSLLPLLCQRQDDQDETETKEEEEAVDSTDLASVTAEATESKEDATDTAPHASSESDGTRSLSPVCALLTYICLCYCSTFYSL